MDNKPCLIVDYDAIVFRPFPVLYTLDKIGCDDIFVMAVPITDVQDEPAFMNELKKNLQQSEFSSLLNKFKIKVRSKNPDPRPVHLIKEEIFIEQIAPDFNPLFVIEYDRKSVDMWEALKIACFQYFPNR